MTLIANPSRLEVEKEDNVVAKLELERSGNGSVVAKLGTVTKTFLITEIAGPETGHTAILNMNGRLKVNKTIPHGTLDVPMEESTQPALFLGPKPVQMGDNGLFAIPILAQMEVNGHIANLHNIVRSEVYGPIVNVQMGRVSGLTVVYNSARMVVSGLTARFSNVRMVANGPTVKHQHNNVLMGAYGPTATAHLEEDNFHTAIINNVRMGGNGQLANRIINNAHTEVYGPTATAHLEEDNFHTATINNALTVVNGLDAMVRIGLALPQTAPTMTLEIKGSPLLLLPGSQATQW
jgi:hypothetical protein